MNHFARVSGKNRLPCPICIDEVRVTVTGKLLLIVVRVSYSFCGTCFTGIPSHQRLEALVKNIVNREYKMKIQEPDA